MKLDDEYAGVPLYLWIAGGGLLAAGAWWYVRRYRAAKAENASTQNLTDGVDRSLRNVGASPTAGGYYAGGGGAAALPPGADEPVTTPAPASVPGAAGPLQPGSTATNASYVPGSFRVRPPSTMWRPPTNLDGTPFKDTDWWALPDSSGVASVPVGWSKV